MIPGWTDAWDFARKTKKSTAMVNVNAWVATNTINMETVRRVALREREDNLAYASAYPTIFELVECVGLILVLVVRFGKMESVSLNVHPTAIGLVLDAPATQDIVEIITINVWRYAPRIKLSTTIMNASANHTSLDKIKNVFLSSAMRAIDMI